MYLEYTFTLLATALLWGNVRGATGFWHGDMEKIWQGDNDLAWSLAEKGDPLWAFANPGKFKYPSCLDTPGRDSICQKVDLDPSCIPTWPFRPDGSQRPAASPQSWPINSNCKHGDNNAAYPSWAERFPTYFTVKKCSDTATRVSYSLFYERDGFLDLTSGGFGHKYDWETVVVEWQSFGDYWYKNRLWFSQHGSYPSVTGWTSDKIWTVKKDDQWGGGYGADLDHPKIFVGWSKHANYLDKYQEATDRFDEHDYTFDHYMYMSTGVDLIGAGPDSEIGRKIAAQDWGDAGGHPVHVWKDLCGV